MIMHANKTLSDFAWYYFINESEKHLSAMMYMGFNPEDVPCMDANNFSEAWKVSTASLKIIIS